MYASLTCPLSIHRELSLQFYVNISIRLRTKANSDGGESASCQLTNSTAPSLVHRRPAPFPPPSNHPSSRPELAVLK